MLFHQRNIFLTILIVFLSITLNAQFTGDSISEELMVEFRIDTLNSESQGSYFITEIARYNYLNLYNTHYNLRFAHECSIIKTPEGHFQCQSVIKNNTLEGNIFYQRFNLSDVLMPAMYNLDIDITQGSSQQHYSFQNLRFSVINELPFRDAAIDPSGEGKFKISNISFYYNENNEQAFRDRIEDIHRFLGFDKLLAFNLQKAENINPEDNYDLLSNFFRITDLMLFREKLEKNKIPFQLPEVYELVFNENHRKLNANLRRLETMFSQNADTLHTAISDDDIKIASQTLIQLQYDYLTLMNQSNHFFEPVFLSTVNFFDSVEAWEETEKLLSKKLLSKADIPSENEILKKLCHTIYADYISETDTLIALQKYNEAVIMAGSATTFCKVYPDTDCEVLTFNKTAQVKYGIFDAYLRIARTAMEKNMPGFARKYLDLAREFQQTNSRVIISSHVVEDLLEDLAWNFFESAGFFYDVKNYKDALENYVNAREIYLMIEIDSYNDLIEKQIKRCLLSN